MVEIFFSQYLANFETSGCGEGLPQGTPTHRFSRYLHKIILCRREKDGKRGLRGVLGRLDSDVLSLEQFDW